MIKNQICWSDESMFFSIGCCSGSQKEGILLLLKDNKHAYT